MSNLEDFWEVAKENEISSKIKTLHKLNFDDISNRKRMTRYAMISSLEAKQMRK